MQDTPFPPIPEALLKALEAMFPERSADLQWTDRQVWFKAGERNIVRFLRAEYEAQQETILETTSNVHGS